MGAPIPGDEVLRASMATTFDVLAWEVELASARCIFLDTVIGDMMKFMPEDKQGDLREGMHTVDLVCQQLTSLSAFARKMSSLASEEDTLPVGGALGEITLGALADRMSTALGGEDRGITDRDNAGDLDLF